MVVKKIQKVQESLRERASTVKRKIVKLFQQMRSIKLIGLGVKSQQTKFSKTV